LAFNAWQRLWDCLNLPVAESNYHRRLSTLVGGDYIVAAEPELDQMLVKELHSEPCVVARLSAI
jgi:hypothetical protein